MLKSFINWLFTTEDMAKEFEEKFPNKCMICSYHRFGYAQGYTDDPMPEPHDCIERKDTNVQDTPRSN